MTRAEELAMHSYEIARLSVSYLGRSTGAWSELTDAERQLLVTCARDIIANPHGCGDGWAIDAWKRIKRKGIDLAFFHVAEVDDYELWDAEGMELWWVFFEGIHGASGREYGMSEESLRAEVEWWG